MYLEIDKELKTKIENITCVDYEFKDNFLPSENIVSIFEDLIYEIDRLEEKYEDLEQDMEDNYIKRPMSDYTGNADDDRF